MSNAEEFKFELIYDGTALNEGAIDANTLGEALTACSDLIERSGRTLFPESPPMILRVRSNFRKGSFEVLMEVSQSYDYFVRLFSSPQAQAIGTLLSVLGISAVGLFQLIQQLRGRKAEYLIVEEKETTREVTRRVLVQVDGQTVSETDERVLKLLQDVGVRDAVERLVEPLKKDGIDVLEIQKDDKTQLHVEKTEVPNFKCPDEQTSEQVSDQSNVLVKIVSPYFNEGNKWRVDMGNRQIWVGIKDEKFIADAKSGEPFQWGDLLKVTLQTRQWIEGGKLKLAQDIVKVHEHIHASAAVPKVTEVQKKIDFEQ